MPSTNLSHSQTNQQQNTWYITLRPTFENSEIVYRFKLIILDEDHFMLNQYLSQTQNRFLMELGSMKLGFKESMNR